MAEKFESENLQPCLSKCRKNSRKNVNCFCQLGEKFWFSEIKDSCWTSAENPETERRDKDTPVGLKNLGATCYVNTFLQLCFHNKVFRSFVYKWNTTNISETIKDNGEGNSTNIFLAFAGDDTNSIFGNLQYLFGLLEYSTRRYVDPSCLVECLGLQRNEQQDAQEFSKLFMSLINKVSAMTCNTIEKHFGGVYKYQTECQTCRWTSSTSSTFYELDLNVKGHSHLSGCLNEFFAVEHLNGDNQYRCSSCQCKRDAKRKIVIDHAPPVLHLQLLRFIYNRETWTKQKVNTNLSFPEDLDMNKYIKFTNPNDGIYHLESVLIHRGLSANSGHYIAHIYDKENGNWCRYNDEEVSLMKGKSLQLGKEDDLEAFEESRAKKQKKNESGTHISKNAYLLVYVRANHSYKEEECREVPFNMRELVVKDNSLFEEWIVQKQQIRSAKIKEGTEKQLEIQYLYNSLYAKPDEPCEWVSTRWLRDWLAEISSAVPPIDNTQLMCRHGMADPRKTADMKRMRATAGLFERYGGLPRLHRLCVVCEDEQRRRLEFNERLAEDMKIFNGLNKPSYKVDTTNAFWLGKKSLKRIKQMAQKEFERSIDSSDVSSCGDDVMCVFNQDCLCKQHDNLNIVESSRKLASAEVWLKINQYLPSAIELSSDSIPCQTCKNEEITSQQEASTMQLLVSEQKQALSFLLADPAERLERFFDQNKNTLSVLLSSFIDNWKICLKRKELLNQVENDEIICEHDKLLYNADELICEAYKTNPEILFVSEPENDLLTSHFTFTNPVQLSYTSTDQDRQYTVTPDFCRECRTSRLAEEEADLKRFVGAPVYVMRRVADDNHNNIFIDRNIQGNKNNNEINNKIPNVDGSNVDGSNVDGSNVDGSNVEENVNECKVVVSPIQRRNISKTKACDFNFEFNPNRSKKSYNRRSGRQRMKRGEYMLKVDSHQTLKDLKKQLTSVFSVLPIEQTIFNEEGVALTQDELPIIELGILPGSHLIMEVDMIHKNEDFVFVPSDQGKSHVKEEGFKGTGLMGAM